MAEREIMLRMLEVPKTWTETGGGDPSAEGETCPFPAAEVAAFLTSGETELDPEKPDDLVKILRQPTLIMGEVEDEPLVEDQVPSEAIEVKSKAAMSPTTQAIMDESKAWAQNSFDCLLATAYTGAHYT